MPQARVHQRADKRGKNSQQEFKGGKQHYTQVLSRSPPSISKRSDSSNASKISHHDKDSTKDRRNQDRIAQVHAVRPVFLLQIWLWRT